MKVVALALLAAVMSLTACSHVDLSDQAHSVEAYYADGKLSADTIEACRAKNEAEHRVMQAKEACKNVRQAEKRRSDEAQAASEAEFNRSMEQLLEERRRARAARRKQLAAG